MKPGGRIKTYKPLSRGTKQLKRGGRIKKKYKPTKEYRGGRVRLSDADWYKQKREMWDECPYPLCGICGGTIGSYDDFQPDHIIPRGLGGGTRDDRRSNLQPSHSWCNGEKGSRRNFVLPMRTQPGVTQD